MTFWIFGTWDISNFTIISEEIIWPYSEHVSIETVLQYNIVLSLYWTEIIIGRIYDKATNVSVYIYIYLEYYAYI